MRRWGVDLLMILIANRWRIVGGDLGDDVDDDNACFGNPV